MPISTLYPSIQPDRTGLISTTGVPSIASIGPIRKRFLLSSAQSHDEGTTGLAGQEQEQFRSLQLQALRWTYLGSAMTHPNFLATVGEFSPTARKQIEEMGPVFS